MLKISTVILNEVKNLKMYSKYRLPYKNGSKKG